MLDNKLFYNWMFDEEKLKEDKEVKWMNSWKRHENATNPSISTLQMFTDKLQ